jgi:hypothetical protein
MPTTWDPKYPEFAVRKAGSGLDDRTSGDDFKIKAIDGTMRPLEWYQPPATSHLHSFAYESFKPGSPFYNSLRKFEQKSILHVRFKPSGKITKVTHYIYYFTDDGYGSQVLETMKQAAHPGAEVVNEILIANKVPYARVA